MPSSGLDAGTLMFAAALLAFLTSGFSYISATTLPRVRESALEWAKAMLILGGACLFWFLTPRVPKFYSFVIGNEMSVIASVLVSRAVYLLTNHRFPNKTALAILVLGASGILATYFFGVDRSVAVITVGVTHFSAALLGGWRLCRQRDITKSRYMVILFSVLLMLGTATASRIWVTIFGAGANAVLPVGPSNTQVFMIAAATLLVVAGSFGFLGVLAEQARFQILDSASRDSLTGLFTRGAFYGKASEVLSKNSTDVALLMVDIDHFKRINDSFGHLAGDMVIRHAARLISGAVRLEALCGRYGGEEFCVLVPGCGWEGGSSIANRFVADAARQSVRLNDGRTVSYTLSVGYVVFRADSQADSPLEYWMERADSALYQAKAFGRNRAVAAANYIASDTGAPASHPNEIPA